MNTYCKKLQSKIINIKHLILYNLKESKDFKSSAPFLVLFDYFPRIKDVKKIESCENCKYPNCEKGRALEYTINVLENRELNEDDLLYLKAELIK
jgi:hypothetical protein